MLGGVSVSAQALTISTKVSQPVSVTAAGAVKAVTVRWAAPSKSTAKITGYQVTATKGSFTKVVKAAASARTLTVSGLANGTKYLISLQSVSGSLASKPVVKSVTTKGHLLINNILFRQPGDMFLGGDDQTLFALSAGPAAIFSTSTPSICSVSGNVVHALAVGDCIVIAKAPSDSIYAAASPVQMLLTVANSPTPLNKTLLWSDEFNGAADSAPNSLFWTADVSDGCPAPYSNCGWGNAEKEYYITGANRQDGSADGILNITANRQSNSTNYNCYYGRCEWLSGKMTTYGKVGFTYGYMEARMKLPSGGGAWPAFWMLGTNISSVGWPRSGEIDIMEYKGASPSITYGTVHYANSGGGHEMLGGTKDTLVDLSLAYHRYGMLWKPDEVTFYIDDNVVYTARKSESGLNYWAFGPTPGGVEPKFYLIFNLAMGGNFGGDVDSNLSTTTLSVDWVRYYSVDGLGKVTN